MFKRLWVSIGASMNNLADQIENHEAVADAMLTDGRHKLARLRMEVKQTSKAITQAVERAIQLESEISLWESRALEPGNSESLALECVERAESVAQQLTQLKEQTKRQRALLQQKQALEVELGEHLENLELKKQELICRESVLPSDSCSSIQLSNKGYDKVFERWETQVLCSEDLKASGQGGLDEVELQFATAERSDRLRQRLKELQERGNSNDDD